MGVLPVPAEHDAPAFDPAGRHDGGRCAVGGGFRGEGHYSVESWGAGSWMGVRRVWRSRWSFIRGPPGGLGCWRFGLLEVYADGGVRYGTDVLKLLALGIRAVGVGRPMMVCMVVGFFFLFFFFLFGLG